MTKKTFALMAIAIATVFFAVLGLQVMLLNAQPAPHPVRPPPTVPPYAPVGGQMLEISALRIVLPWVALVFVLSTLVFGTFLRRHK